MKHSLSQDNFGSRHQHNQILLHMQSIIMSTRRGVGVHGPLTSVRHIHFVDRRATDAGLALHWTYDKH